MKGTYEGAALIVGLLLLGLTWGYLPRSTPEAPTRASVPMQTERAGDLARQRAENASAQGRHDWARLYYREDLERHPERLESLRDEAFAWRSGYQQSLSTSAELMKEYLRREPSDDEVRRLLVSSLNLIGAHEEAMDLLPELDHSPASELVRAELLQESHPEHAARAAERAVAAEPGLARALALAARLHERTGEHDLALQRAEEAVEVNPLDSQTFYLLARLYRRADRQSDADWALGIHGRLQALFHEGTKAALTPREELEVIRALAQELPPASAESYAFRRTEALALAKAGTLEEAEAAVVRLLQHDELELDDAAELARLVDDRGLRSVSRKVFRRILELDPDNRGALASLALIEYEAGQREEALDRLGECIERDPHFARYHYLLGMVLEAEGREDDALLHYRRAVKLAPWEWGWREALADRLLAADLPDEFRQVVNAAPESLPRIEAYRAEHSRLLSP